MDEDKDSVLNDSTTEVTKKVIIAKTEEGKPVNGWNNIKEDQGPKKAYDE